MPTTGITRFSPDAIENIDDVKTWARDREIRIDHRLEQIEAALVDHKNSIAKNWRLLMYATCGFGGTLGVVVILSGLNLITQRFF